LAKHRHSGNAFLEHHPCSFNETAQLAAVRSRAARVWVWVGALLSSTRAGYNLSAAPLSIWWASAISPTRSTGRSKSQH